jgi:hypothetical protein
MEVGKTHIDLMLVGQAEIGSSDTGSEHVHTIRTQ